jgi:C-methyltransferase
VQALPPSAVLANLITGKIITQCLAVAVRLGVPDRLATSPRSAYELALEADVQPDALYRMLRALSVVGVVVEHEGRRFSLTPVGDLLRTEVPGSMAAFARFFGEGWHNELWSELLHCVTTGETAFSKLHGDMGFGWFAAHPSEAAVFNEAMTSLSKASAEPIAAAYDFSGCETVTDVGGGHGFLLATVLQKNPHLRGKLFDVPHTATGARKLLERAGLADRVEVVPGDFFESVPEGCDAYLLKHIIHDWDDERSTVILGNIARAMVPHGRVLVMEQIIPAQGVPSGAPIIDLEMLVSAGGRERTVDELAALFARARLRLRRVIPTASPVQIVEAARV